MRKSTNNQAFYYRIALCSGLAFCLGSGLANAVDIQATRMDFYPPGETSTPVYDDTLGALVPGEGTSGFINALPGRLDADAGVVSTGPGNTASGGFGSDAGPAYGDPGTGFAGPPDADGFFGNHWTAQAVWSADTAGPHIWSGTTAAGSFSYSFTLAPGDVAFGLYFDWGASQDIPVLAVFRETSPGIWTPVNTDGDASPGTAMQTQPFPGQTPAFSGVTAQTPPDSTPNDFTFSDPSNVEPSTIVESNAIEVLGINVPSPISISGDPSSEYDINGTGWTSDAGMVNVNDTVRVRHMSSAGFLASTTTTLDIGGVTEDFVSTTREDTFEPDIDPDTPLGFVDLLNANLDELVESNAITVTGINTAAPISITSDDPNAAFLISVDNGATYGPPNGTAPSSVTVNEGHVVKVRHRTANAFSTPISTTLVIGGVSETFTSTTLAADTDPNPFSFNDAINVQLDISVESEPTTISGINAAASISVGGAAGSEYAISTDGGVTFGPWRDITSPGTVNNLDRVKVRHTSAATNDTQTQTILTIGGRDGTFTSTTRSAQSGSDGNNFTMIASNGSTFGGANDVFFSWDGSLNTDPATASVNAEISSNTGFLGPLWTAYEVKVYGPGSYVISTADTMGSPGCPFPASQKETCASGGNYTITVNQGQIMAHMKFAWSTSQGIDVINIWEADSVFGPSDIFAPPGSSLFNHSWALMSADGDGDNVNGLGMIDGPFPGYRANFNVMMSGSVVPPERIPVSAEAPETKTPGCTISALPISPLDRGDWWLVGGFIVWLAWLRRRTVQQQSPTVL